MTNHLSDINFPENNRNWNGTEVILVEPSHSKRLLKEERTAKISKYDSTVLLSSALL